MLDEPAAPPEMEAEEDGEVYWALYSPDHLVKELIGKQTGFYGFCSNSTLFRKILRLWQYYHNLYYDGREFGDMETQIAGSDGEQSLVGINHLRSVMHLLMTYTTQNRPAWDTMAVNSDVKSLRQTRLGNDILDEYMESKGVEMKLRRAVEHALVLTTGYILTTWDETMGREVKSKVSQDLLGNTIGGEIYREGDVSVENLTIFDVIYDFSIRDWKENQWVMVRKSVNKWDLVARYPEKKEEILKLGGNSKVAVDLNRLASFELAPKMDTDNIDYWEFYHKKTPSLPNGRKVCFVGETMLLDEDYMSEGLPVHRMLAAEILLTGFGYSPGFDLLAPQESLNMLFSTMVTNANNFGQQKVWLKTGNTVNMADLDAGTTVVQCRDKPEPLNLLGTPREILEGINIFIQQIEYLSGINSVARGQPEASLRSGDSLAIIDAKAIQFASNLVANYYDLLTNVGQSILELLQKNATSKRVMAVAGVNNKSQIKDFSSTDIDAIQRVRVVPGHPIMRTIAGRTHVADRMLGANLVTKEEYFTVLTTGQLKPLTRAHEAMLSIVHEENELLLSENPQDPMPQALIHDNHILHIKEHLSVLDTTEMRMHPVIAPRVLAHCKQHRELLMTPEAQEFGAFLGYMPGMGPAAGPMGPMPVPGDQGLDSAKEAKAKAMEPSVANG